MTKDSNRSIFLALLIALGGVALDLEGCAATPGAGPRAASAAPAPQPSPSASPLPPPGVDFIFYH